MFFIPFLSFFGDPKRVYKQEFDMILRNTPGISPRDRQYLYQVFSRDLVDGLTEWEVRNKINKLRYNTKDVLTPGELDILKRKLSTRLEK